MSTNQPDRPPRTRPRPAADAGVDPIDYRPGGADEDKPTSLPPATTGPAAAAGSAPTAPATEAPAPTSTPSAVAGGVEVTVQLSTRVSPDVNDVLTEAKLRTGKAKRALIEEAILRTWGV